MRAPAISTTLQVTLLMLLVHTAASISNVLVRGISDDLHVLEITFFRNLFGLMVALPILRPTRVADLRVAQPKWLFLASATQVLAMATFFGGLALMPLAEVQALGFTKPLFVTIGAALILGEIVGYRRWTAIGVGFLGVLLVLQPAGNAFQPAALLVLLSSVFFTGTTLILKHIATSDRPVTIVLYQNLFMTLLSLVPALFVWRTPSLAMLPWLIGLAVGGVIAWIATMRAMALADASFLMPFEFTRLPITALFAFIVFAQVPSIWTWIGGAVICGAVLYVAQREAALAQRARTTAP